MKTVVVEHDYAVPAAELWALVTDFGALKVVMKSIVTFEGLPEGCAQTGQSFDVQVSLFGLLPRRPYHMEVLECDNARMVLRSSERGVGVKSWRHTINVVPTASGSHLCDQIDIDAGLFTPIVALWARRMLRARHKPRLALLADKA